jgi:hypothetical protein
MTFNTIMNTRKLSSKHSMFGLFILHKGIVNKLKPQPSEEEDPGC